DAEKVTAAPQADDASLLRRLMLDVAGRIPTSEEAKTYVANGSAVKRTELVDRLLASPDFVWHQRNEFDRMLLPNKPNDGDFRKYLLWAVKENRPWDAMFRDMLVGDEADENRKHALTFIKSRARELDDMLNDTAIVFFGVNVTCAKCHDHPLTPDWKQHHYFGMASFFSRTYVTKKNLLAERPFGEVKFKSKRKDDTKGEQTAKFEFLTGAVIDEPVVERSEDDKKKIEEVIKAAMQKDDAPPPEKPSFSPREKLVEIALRAEDNRFFASNIVNRVWDRLFGRGLVHPVDQLHSGNAPSHPELLDWLTRDLVAHNYDLKRLIRGIVLSQAYSRSSEWMAGSMPPDASLFAVTKVKPLTPRQYAVSLLIARQAPDSWPSLDKPDEWVVRREQLENGSNGYTNFFEMPGESFQVAVDEALLFSNSKRIEDELLRDSKTEIVGYLKSLSDNTTVIDAAFQTICSRPPRDDERAAMEDYLQKHSADRIIAIRQIVWALLTGPEMRFSY
ncbi:MAG: hypothetical protein FD138_2737, partial [Planctomycetota bacterium]